MMNSSSVTLCAKKSDTYTAYSKMATILVILGSLQIATFGLAFKREIQENN